MDLFNSPNIVKMAAERDLNGLYKLLAHHDPNVRVEAAGALADLDDGYGWRYLMDTVRTSHEEAEVAAAAQVLGELEHPRAIPVLEEALKRSHGETAQVIKSALESISGPESDAALRRAGYEPVVPHLTGLQLVDYRGGYVRSQRMDTGQIEFLTAEQHYNNAVDLREAEITERALIEDSLALWLNPDWAEPWYLRGVLFEDLDRYFEASLCYRFVLELQPNHAEAQEALDDLENEYGFEPLEPDLLIQDLNDKKWELRRDAAAGLGEIGTEVPPEAVDALIETLEDEEREVRHAVIEALGNVEDERAAEPLAKQDESSWLLRFAIIEALAQIGSVSGLEKVLRREMEDAQVRNPLFSAEKDPLLAVESERQMEIGVLAFEKTGDLLGLLEMAEGNAWVETEEEDEEEEAVEEYEPVEPQVSFEISDAFGEREVELGEEEEEEEPDEDLESYVDEVALMISLALERVALPRIAELDAPTLKRLAEVPDLTLLDVTAGEDAEPTLVHDLSAVRDAAKAELEKR